MRAERTTWLLRGVLGLWLVGLVVGGHAIYAYATHSGDDGGTPARWPAASHLHAAQGVTAVMFVHPECPCSRASIHELGDAIRDAGAGAEIEVVFEGMGDGELWSALGAMSTVERVLDDGTEDVRFGARTSGYTVVYDARGALTFHGGITGSRGHVGNNVGRMMFEQALTGKTNGAHPVFGCALSQESS